VARVGSADEASPSPTFSWWERLILRVANRRRDYQPALPRGWRTYRMPEGTPRLDLKRLAREQFKVTTHRVSQDGADLGLIALELAGRWPFFEAGEPCEVSIVDKPSDTAVSVHRWGGMEGEAAATDFQEIQHALESRTIKDFCREYGIEGY
jgi:hypothetical protein